MKLEIPNCPTCGLPAEGVLEVVTGTASLTEPDDFGNCEYGGETEIDWNNQTTVLENGKATLFCRKDHDWKSEIREEA